MASAVRACTMGIMPSTSPGISTASHSSPFAACIVAKVTAAATGACPVSSRSTSSAANSASVAPGRDAARSSASPAIAARDSQRSLTAPRAAGGTAVSPADASTWRTAAGSSPGSPVASVPAPRRPGSPAHAAPAPGGPRAGRRTARPRAPRTARSASASARSNRSACALIRSRMAISWAGTRPLDQRRRLGGDPGRLRLLVRVLASPSAPARSAVAPQAPRTTLPPQGPAPTPPAASRFAAATTCGVDR